jgi:hypothetical protein
VKCPICGVMGKALSHCKHCDEFLEVTVATPESRDERLRELLEARIWILAYPCGLRSEADDTIFAGRSELVVCPRWPAEPSDSRVDDGFPGWMVGAFGDAVVPEIPYRIGRAIMSSCNGDVE